MRRGKVDIAYWVARREQEKRDKEMAHFRATIVGNKGEVSRLSNKTDGILTTAYGWDGAVTCRLSHRAGRDWAVVTLWPGPNQETGESIVIYEGYIDKAAREAFNHSEEAEGHGGADEYDRLHGG
jgi:hypothetical protein